MTGTAAKRSAEINHIQALKIIDGQVQRKLAMKKSWRKKLKQTVERPFRHASYRVISRPRMQIEQYNGSSALGADEFRRDIADGVTKYVDLLKKRGLQIHTVIVLG